MPAARAGAQLSGLRPARGRAAGLTYRTIPSGRPGSPSSVDFMLFSASVTEMLPPNAATSCF